MAHLSKSAAAGGVVLLGLSAYPGVLVDLVFLGLLTSPLWLPALAVGVVIASVIRAREPREKSVRLHLDPIDEGIGVSKAPPTRLRRTAAWLAILCLSLALIVAGIPMRAAFLLSRPAFQSRAATAPVTRYKGEPLGRLLGVYYVDRYAADPRGGAYFRTHAGADGLGPDTMSYGFACRPNRQGTPFGRARYRLRHVVGDWYAFSASDDY